MKTKQKLFKSPKVKSFFKTLMLISYCALICAAILFSFKSVFNSIAGAKSNMSGGYVYSTYLSKSSSISRSSSYPL